MTAVSVAPAGTGPFDTAEWAQIGTLDGLDTTPEAAMEPLAATNGASVELEATQIDSDTLHALFGIRREILPATRAVLIESTDVRPVHEPTPPAPFRARRGLWAWFSGANAAAERSWRGRYAAYQRAHDAWVARGCPTEEERVVRYYFPTAVLNVVTGEGTQ